MKVLIDSLPILMPPQRYELFMLLWNARGQFITRAEMVDHLWDELDFPDWYLHIVENHIHFLGKSLRPTRFSISRDRRLGYRLTRMVKIRRADLPAGLRKGDRVQFPRATVFVPWVSTFPISPPVETDDYIIIAESQQWFELEPVKGT